MRSHSRRRTISTASATSAISPGAIRPFESRPAAPRGGRAPATSRARRRSDATASMPSVIHRVIVMSSVENRPSRTNSGAVRRTMPARSPVRGPHRVAPHRRRRRPRPAAQRRDQARRRSRSPRTGDTRPRSASRTARACCDRARRCGGAISQSRHVATPRPSRARPRRVAPRRARRARSRRDPRRGRARRAGRSQEGDETRVAGPRPAGPYRGRPRYRQALRLRGDAIGDVKWGRQMPESQRRFGATWCSPPRRRAAASCSAPLG